MDKMSSPPRARYPLLLLSLAILLIGAWVGLLRLGWRLPPLRPGLPAIHGGLMVSGFLGTVIGLERAVALAALGRRWTYLAPALTSLGALMLIAGLPARWGQLLILAGSIVLIAVFVEIIRRQPASFTVLMGLGAVLWAVGNALWLVGRPVPIVVWWWAGYLVLTIAGERLEMTRLVRVSRAAQSAFGLAVGGFLVGLLLISALGMLDVGVRVVGLSLVGLAVWLLRYDIARRTVRQTGLTRFIAVNLLTGYVWLAAGGALMARFGFVFAGPHYDAILHAIFLGFVFALIFGHAPVIFPAVLRVQMRYTSILYSHVIALHLTLLLRVLGDLANWPAVRQWGGMLNFVALLLFLLNTVRSIDRGEGV